MFNLVIIWRFLFEFAAGRLLLWGSGSPAEMLLALRASLQSNFPLQQKFGCQEILFLLITLLGLPAGLVVKNLPASAGDSRDAGSVSGLGRFPGVGNDNPL